MSTLVTVIVPGFDVEEYAAEALESLRAQTLPRWRAILVDDGSADGTGRVFDDAARRDDRFRVVRHGRRRGLGAARNTALDLVDTRYVAFLDGDDVMTPTALATLVGSLEASGSDLVVGAYVRLRPEGARYLPGPVQPWVSAATDPRRIGVDLDAHPEVTANVVAWSKVSRTEFWREHDLRFPEAALYEDQAVAQRMYASARAFDVVPDVVVQWRVRADGSSITQREADPRVLRACLAAMRDGLDVLAGHGAARRARAAQILRMDVPRLAALPLGDDDRALLAAFAAHVAAL
ncbi:glycosyltransferase family 2 protein [Microbacterium oryzae]|uniref:glycosyltransferase family 2 protein n=1 Tax=Microbacterium oryzae TaxID=743009 RepID=UPI0025AEFD4D|nr:glycosyltransferase family 2 protein [Microbacterium oryzae]MDN3309717.1 glycosyltransferase family 2 protein [Microbacterium oryzae]